MRKMINEIRKLNLPIQKEALAGTWYICNSDNLINYKGCGIYSYHIEGDKIMLDKHYTYNMELNYIEEYIDYDTTNILRVSSWEIQLLINGVWS